MDLCQHQTSPTSGFSRWSWVSCPSRQMVVDLWDDRHPFTRWCPQLCLLVYAHAIAYFDISRKSNRWRHQSTIDPFLSLLKSMKTKNFHHFSSFFTRQFHLKSGVIPPTMTTWLSKESSQFSHPDVLIGPLGALGALGAGSGDEGLFTSHFLWLWLSKNLEYIFYLLVRFT